MNPLVIAALSLLLLGQAGDPTVWTAINQPQASLVQLQCRGGVGFEFRSLGFKSTPQGDARVAVAMVFAAGQRAAGSTNENLPPGTCAPSDRPLAATEPREVHFITAAFSQPYTGAIDVTRTAAEYHPDVRSIADYLKDPAHYWTFHASDTHRGYFDVTVHEYWIDRSKPTRPAPERPDPPTVARWLVRVRISGGIAGSRREVSLNGDGRLQESGSGTFGDVQCSATLTKPDVQHVEAAIARSHPETWPNAYPLKGDGCCDQLKYVLHVDQEDSARSRTSHETSWVSENAAAVPEPVSALFNIVYEARRACAF